MKSRLPLIALIQSLGQLAGSAAEPLGDGYFLFWGDVHGHTIYSDGTSSPAEFFRHAREEANLDFVIATDHDFGHEAPWRMPVEHWQSLQQEANQQTENGRFIAIAGYEWTSQPKYWSGFTNGVSEKLFPGPPRFFNHKNVYFPGQVDYLFSAKDTATFTPDLLAAAVRKAGGLIHNSHPSADPDSREQFAYDSNCSDVIVNTEMVADTIHHEGKIYDVRGEEVVRAFLSRGGMTGFVGGSDTHESKPAARTAVVAKSLTKEALFDALRQRRNYAVSHAPIVLEFKINGHWMGEELTTQSAPQIAATIRGTARLETVEVIRNGEAAHRISPAAKEVRFTWTDSDFTDAAWYYLRVTQAGADKHGNPSLAWSSPIWVKRAAR